MIPHTIHYCWFGGKPLPRSAKKYIKTWKRFFPGYEIKEWNESNFDVNAVPYTADAYKDRKYAFVSDYVRFWALYNYGGVYFDTDVEVIRPMDDILENGMFMGLETKAVPVPTRYGVAPGLGIAAEAGNNFYKRVMDKYSQMEYGTNAGDRIINVVDIITDMMLQEGWRDENVLQTVEGISIYPTAYFCPSIPGTSRLDIQADTRTIHHYAGSWLPKSVRMKNKIGDILGRRFLDTLVKLKHIFKKG